MAPPSSCLLSCTLTEQSSVGRQKLSDIYWVLITRYIELCTLMPLEVSPECQLSLECELAVSHVAIKTWLRCSALAAATGSWRMH